MRSWHDRILYDDEHQIELCYALQKNVAKMILNCDYRWQIVRHTWKALRQLRPVEMATII